MAAKIRVPEHVVYRAFPEETVMLNLETGRYHGLNSTGREMLEALERSGSVAAALSELTQRYDAPRGEIAQDLRNFCADLLARDLIELDAGPPRARP